MSHEELEKLIDGLYDHPVAPDDADATWIVSGVIDLLDAGELRVAEKVDGEWIVNQWAKKAILLYFRHTRMETTELGPFEYHDKIPLKSNYAALKVRVVPPATARRGSFLSPGVVLMPSYVNIGAGSGRARWSIPGRPSARRLDRRGRTSLRRRRHRRRPRAPAANPVIVEDRAFIGSRCIVVEGIIVGE